MAPARMRVERRWPGCTVVCFGGGPSLTRADVDVCRGRMRAIAINTAYQLAPWADVLYGCDAKWWAWHRGVPTFRGLKYALEPKAGAWPNAQVLENTGRTGLELAPTGLRHGKNSGYQAINLAVHLGAARIVLLGYDLQLGPRGEHHWHGAHPNRVAPFLEVDAFFLTLVQPLAALGIEVLNCSRRTALTAFPRRPLEEVLGECRPGS